MKDAKGPGSFKFQHDDDVDKIEEVDGKVVLSSGINTPTARKAYAMDKSCLQDLINLGFGVQQG